MKCLYCQKDAGHNAACPEEGDVQTSSDRRRRWQAGWDNGRTGVANPHPEDETFTLGFKQGEALRQPKLPAPTYRVQVSF